MSVRHVAYLLSNTRVLVMILCTRTDSFGFITHTRNMRTHILIVCYHTQTQNLHTYMNIYIYIYMYIYIYIYVYGCIYIYIYNIYIYIIHIRIARTASIPVYISICIRRTCSSSS